MEIVYFRTPAKNISNRSSYKKLGQPLRKNTFGQNSIPYLTPSYWNCLPNDLKETKHLNTVKH